ncbi:MAG TPA: hypothetical protein VHE35_09045 [Kofleriaceae bacterium]|nr:hypothetical protein [Kofleriaceae bacterium]
MKKLLVCLGVAMLASTAAGCEIYFGHHHGHHGGGGDDGVTHYCEGTGDATTCYTCYEDDYGEQECFPDNFGCATDDQCARGCYCDEQQNTCVEAGTCQADADCGYGLECDCSGSCVPVNTGSRTCDPDSCQATGCPQGEVCTAEGTCVPDQPPPLTCDSDADCAAGCFCQDGQCVETSVCTQDSECPAGQTCDEGRMTCEPITGTCYSEPGANCPAAPTCAAGELAEVGADGCYTGLCLPEAQCPDDPPRPVCSDIHDWAQCLAQEAAGFCHPLLTGTNCHPQGNPNMSCAPGEPACVCETINFDSCVDAN